MQTNDGNQTDREKRISYQRETIRKVTDWLREEGLEPQEITHLRKDSSYYGVIISNEEEEKTEQTEKQQRRAFHILFPGDKFDSLRISEIIIFDLQSQKSYSSLGAKTNGIFEQNAFYFDLQRALLHMNVLFVIRKNMRELQSLEIYKVIFFDGLTKNELFDTIDTIHNSIEIARIRTNQLRDSVLSSDGAHTEDNKI
ncbi:MAG: DUF2299 family protein [Thermoproteota archaeon]|nr:DUF2299 family protein [Thermoproteota archaeon]